MNSNKPSNLNKLNEDKSNEYDVKIKKLQIDTQQFDDVDVIPEEIVFVPENENIWKLIINYGEVNQNDIKSIRQVCQQANSASQPYIQFSEDKFSEFMKKIDPNGWYLHKNQNPTVFIEKMEELSDQICDLIDLNKDNEHFGLILESWMKNVKYTLNYDSQEPDIILQKQTQNIINQGKKVRDFYRPSFKKSLKKVSKIIGGTATGAITVATVPLALIGLPFFLSKKSGIGELLVAPVCLAGYATYAIFDGINDPNLRNANTYLALNGAITKIEKKMNEHIYTRQIDIFDGLEDSNKTY